MIKMIKKIISKYIEEKIEKDIIRKYGFEFFCPNCGIGLNRGKAEIIDNEDGVRAKCQFCLTESLWNFDLFAVPVVVSINGKKTSNNYPTLKEMMEAFKNKDKIYINEEKMEAEVI
jgi:predicted RNA-binding Zn-ribbon protein involved in translation (DUF1610 family)